jgi:hypothetical protein
MLMEDASRQKDAADRAGLLPNYGDNQVVNVVVKDHMAVLFDKVEWFLGKDLVANLAAL